MLRKLKLCVQLMSVTLALMPCALKAGVIFQDSQDNFNAENLGPDLFPAYPGIGLHLDLDGSDTAAGIGSIATKNPLVPPAGSYVLSFDLGNNPGRPGQPDVSQLQVTLGSLYSETFQVQGDVPLQSISRVINVGAPANATLTFAAQGAPDYYGPISDNISVSDSVSGVPEPASLLFFCCRLAGRGRPGARASGPTGL